MGIFGKSKVDGELDLRTLCMKPSGWGTINGEPRTVRRSHLCSLLSRRGYTLTRLQFRISTKGGVRSYWSRSFLYGECLSSEGKTFCFNVSPLYKWDVNDQIALEGMKVGYEDGYAYYCPSDALLRFEREDDIVVGVHFLSVQAPAYPNSEYPKNRLQWDIIPHGYYVKGTDDIVYGAP